MSSRTGGRQGCKLGATIFNTVYTVALDMLHWELEKANIVLRIQVPGEAFWQTADPDNEDCDNVVDAAFVDDECVVLVARTAATLDTAINSLLIVLVDIFSVLHLQVNWKPGKTECLFKYRGSGAIARREQ